MARKALSLAIALIFAIGSAPAMAEGGDAAGIRLAGSTIIYRGPITAEANQQVRALLERDRPVHMLDITSPGGEVGTGMDLGEPVADMKRFGIGDIMAPDGYGNHLQVNGRLFTLLQLSDHADMLQATVRP